ncbi:MAG: hypothetical protein Q8N51_01165 [Gammaproteobacteria bacterium]|nr:hypothetical protein [Gammaproteobacteria bacterium]
MADHDALLRRLSALPVLTSDPQRAERLRARCRTRLAPPTRDNPWRLEPSLLAGFSLLYLSALVIDLLRLRSLL